MQTPALNAHDICQDLCRFLQSNVLQNSEPITPSTSLTDLGIDSFSLMEIILYLENQYTFSLPLNKLTPENTASVQALAACFVAAVASEQSK